MTTDRETSGTKLLVSCCHVVAPGHWHIINNPRVHVPLNDPLTKKMDHLPIPLHVQFILLGAKVLIGHVLTVYYFIGRGPQTLPEYHLPKVLGRILVRPFRRDIAKIKTGKKIFLLQLIIIDCVSIFDTLFI